MSETFQRNPPYFLNKVLSSISDIKGPGGKDALAFELARDYRIDKNGVIAAYIPKNVPRSFFSQLDGTRIANIGADSFLVHPEMGILYVNHAFVDFGDIGANRPKTVELFLWMIANPFVRLTLEEVYERYQTGDYFDLASPRTSIGKSMIVFFEDLHRELAKFPTLSKKNFHFGDTVYFAPDAISLDQVTLFPDSYQYGGEPRRLIVNPNRRIGFYRGHRIDFLQQRINSINIFELLNLLARSGVQGYASERLMEKLGISSEGSLKVHISKIRKAIRKIDESIDGVKKDYESPIYNIFGFGYRIDLSD